MDKLATGITVIIVACSAIFAQNVMILREISNMWLAMSRAMDAELKVLKITVERLDAHAEMLKNIAGSQVNIANMLILLHGKEQNAGQSRCGEDFSNEADVSITESGSDGRKED